MATMGTSVRWFIDLRDPWAGPFTKAWESDHRTWLFRTLSRRLEGLAFRTADGVITTSRKLAEVVAAKYPDVAVGCVPNGVDPECLPTPQDPYPGLGIAYAGSLYGGRDLAPVVRALLLFFERHPEAARAGSKLRIAGHAEGPHALALADAVGEARLESYVEMLGPLSRAQALAVVSRSRLAVVLAQEQELQIPAKLYESVAVGIPTLVVAGADSATALEGNRIGAVVRDPRDVAGIADVLEQLWRDNPGARSPCPVTITYEAIARLMDEFLTGNAARTPGSAW